MGGHKFLQRGGSVKARQSDFKTHYLSIFPGDPQLPVYVDMISTQYLDSYCVKSTPTFEYKKEKKAFIKKWRRNPRSTNAIDQHLNSYEQWIFTTKIIDDNKEYKPTSFIKKPSQAYTATDSQNTGLSPCLQRGAITSSEI